MNINEHDIRTAFDAEGTLAPSMWGGQHRWVIQISNTDLHWLELLQAYLVEHGYHAPIQTLPEYRNPKWKTAYRISIDRRDDMARFLKEFPPLTAKRQKRAAEFNLWLHRPRPGRGPSKHTSTVKAVEQMLKNSRRMI